MLRLQGLRKSYGDFVALHGLDLAIAAGEILALLGPNGAGKSTAVKCVVGLLRPDAGTVHVDGVDALQQPQGARRRIGYLPEVARLHEALTPWEYLLLKGRLFDLEDAKIRATGERLLAGFDLLDRADEPMTAFSKGMLQKVSIAGALLTGPKLLVFDEPLSGLDVNAALLVKGLLRALADSGRAILFSSHVMDVVERLCDRIAILDGGRVVATGTFEELSRELRGGSLESIFASLTGDGDAEARIARALAALK
jgi:ABC-2 type transport system ATP-binding protein